jgi:hypothetical protein
MRNWAAAVMMAGAVASTHSPADGDFHTQALAYAKQAPQSNAKITPFLTVGDSIPRTGGTGRFLVVGIPDGLGLYWKPRKGDTKGDTLTMLSSHEFTPSQGRPAGPLQGGARVSEFTLSIQERETGKEIVVSSGKTAIERIHVGDVPQPAPGSWRFGKLCSATLADQRVGFDRPIFMTSEELSGDSTFDRRGGQSFAVFEGNAYALPRLGRFRGENRVPVPFTDSTVVFCLEDEDRSAKSSQLYMYVGDKRPKARDALSINGLNTGHLNVFAAESAAIHGESQFKSKGGSLAGRWKPVPWDFPEAVRADSALEVATQAANAFDFMRVEDGAANPSKAGEFWFVTTGKDSTENPFGRLYRLNFDPKHPTGPAQLTLVLVGTREGMVSPDNIDLNRHGEIAICEDPSYELDADLGLSRDTRFWIYSIAADSLFAVAELDRDAARTHALAADARNSNVGRTDKPGRWEFSGVVDAEDYLGRGAWILDVQAHSLRIVPVPETVEGGQYLQVIWKPPARGGP